MFYQLNRQTPQTLRAAQGYSDLPCEGTGLPANAATSEKHRSRIEKSGSAEQKDIPSGRPHGVSQILTKISQTGKSSSNQATPSLQALKIAISNESFHVKRTHSFSSPTHSLAMTKIEFNSDLTITIINLQNTSDLRNDHPA